MTQTKSILVIDTPNTCYDCKLCVAGNTLMYQCACTEEEFEFIHGERKEFCPLKKIPLRASNGIIRSKYTDGLKDGWNDLIDYLLGNNSKLLKQYMPADVLLSKAEDYLAEKAIDAAEARAYDKDYADILEKHIKVKQEFLNELYKILRL